MKSERLKLAKAEFERVRCEEEARSAREQNVQKAFQLRHLEDINNENAELQEKVNRLRNEVEEVRQRAQQQVDQVRSEMAEAVEKVVAAQQAAPALDPAQKAELLTAIARLNNELIELRIKNEELCQQIRQSGLPSEAAATSLEKQSNQNFKNLFACLLKARRMLQLMSELIESGHLTNKLSFDLDSSSGAAACTTNTEEQLN